MLHSIGKSASTTNILPQLEGYKCDRFGIPKKTIVLLKMRQHKKEEKKPKASGGPGMYHKEQSWQVPIPKFSSGT